MKARYIIGIIALIIILLVIDFFNGGVIHGLLTDDTDSVVDFIRSFGIISGVVFVIIVILEVVFAPVPGLVLYVAGGIIFGTFVGGSLALFGNVIGAVIAYYIALKLGRDYVKKKQEKKTMEMFGTFMDRFGVYAIFLLRINPFTSSDVFSYLAGVYKMPIRQFVIGTTLGLAPLVFLQAYLGQGFIMGSPWLMSVFGVLCAVYVVVFVWWIVGVKK